MNIFVFTHTCTHSTLNRAGFKMEEPGNIQLALAEGGRRMRRDKETIVAALAPTVASTQEVSLELEEQEVLILRGKFQSAVNFF